MGKYVAGDTFKLKKSHPSKTSDNYEFVFEKGSEVTLFEDKYCREKGIEICIAYRVPNKSKKVFRMHYIPFSVLELVEENSAVRSKC